MARSQSPKYKSILHLAAAVLILAASNICFSADYFRGHANSVFSNKANKHRAQLIPVRMMTNEQLFLSVNAERDRSMSLEQQRTNYNWLVNYRSRDYAGSAAVRNVLRTAFYSLKPLVTSPKQGRLSESATEKQSAFTDINNYRLNVSDDKLLVGFKYSF